MSTVLSVPLNYRQMRYLLRWTLCTILLGLASAAPARARWGNEKCSLATHCYAVADWEMEGASEEVKGAELHVTTNAIEAQQYSEGAFLDDEMWVGFPNKESGWWETGQTAGAPGNCCTLHPFIALALRGSGYGYEEYVWSNVNAEPTNLYSIQDPASNGNWCFYISGVNQGCRTNLGYWSEYAHQLEAGIEASSSSIKPVNSGSQEVNATATNGTVKEWKGAKHHAVLETVNYNGESVAGVMCIGPNTKSNFYGNAIWSVC